jgi:hypothetical protein
MSSPRVTGVTMSCSRVPNSRSRTIDMDVMMSIVMERIIPMIPGTMKMLLFRAGL